MSDKLKRKRCSAEGCRKLSIKDGSSTLCEACKEQLENQEDELFGCTQLTETEAERWGRLDAEIRNHLLNCKVVQLQQHAASLEERERCRVAAEIESNLQQDYNNKQASRKASHDQYLQQMTSAKEAYQTLTRELAEKYKVEVSKMSIDPDTRVIREL